jgi:hypothetical protein
MYIHVRVEQKHWVHTILAFLLQVHFVGKNVAMNIIIVKLLSLFDFLNGLDPLDKQLTKCLNTFPIGLPVTYLPTYLYLKKVVSSVAILTTYLPTYLHNSLTLSFTYILTIYIHLLTQ